MSKLILISGISGSGKDTSAEIIKNLPPFAYAQVIKFSRPYKDFLEELYNLPYRYLDGEEGKGHKLTTGMTMLNVLISHYKWVQSTDSGLYARPVAQEIQNLINYKIPVIVTDCRNQTEYDLLTKVKCEKFIHIQLEGRGIELESDKSNIVRQQPPIKVYNGQYMSKQDLARSLAYILN